MDKKRKKKSFKWELSNKIDPTKCRICGVEDGLIPIFDNPSHPKISRNIEHFSGVVISKTDKLPKRMCQPCLDLLDGCVTFRTLCRKTHRTMLKVIVKTESLEDETSAVRQGTGQGEESSASSVDLGLPTFSDAEQAWGCTKCGGEYQHTKAYNRHLLRCTSRAPPRPAPSRLRPLQSPAGGGDTAPDTPPAVKSEEITKRRFLCDVCGKTAFSNAGLLIHKNIHSDVFPWACEAPGCEYRGRTLDLLKVHRRSHLTTDQKPYKCAHCPKACSTTSNLNKHVRHVHSTDKPHKGGRFQCSYCDKAFSYQHDMKRHVRDIHLRQGTVECDVCYKKFNTKKILQGHRWKIHKIKGERHGRLPAYLLVQAERAERAPDYCEHPLAAAAVPPAAVAPAY